MNATLSDIDHMVFDLLERGVDDWCFDAEVFSIVIEHFGQGEYQSQSQTVMRILEIVVNNGWMIAGYYDNAVGFLPWKEDNETILQRIGQGLLTRKSIPVFGELFWLAITPEGEKKYKEAKNR